MIIQDKNGLHIIDKLPKVRLSKDDKLKLKNHQESYKMGSNNGYNQALAEVEKIISRHNDCNDYHKSFNEKKTDYFYLTCIAQILIDLQKLKEKKE